MNQPAPEAPIILFGGTFDPPHTGHVALALRAAELVDARTVLFMPAGVNPQKSDQPPTDGRHRVAMLEAAIAGEPRAKVTRIELERSGPSYTVDTVEALSNTLGRGHPPLRLLIGADQALNFRSWKRWEDLEALAEPLILPRAPHPPEKLSRELAEVFPENPERWIARILPIPCLEASSTDVRTLVGDDEALERLVPPPVAEYIRSEGLYGFGPEGGRIET